MKDCLNLGCGTDIRSECINLDCIQLPGVDIVHDLNSLPLPFPPDSFRSIYCLHIIEHLDYIPLLKEIHRILKKNGIVQLRMPHFSSRYSYVDPTHKKVFSFETLYFFTKTSRYNREYYFDFLFERVLYAKIHFSQKIIINKTIENIMNWNDGFRRIYESTLFSRLFPALDVEIFLKK